eukprot:Rmarinus@m.19100
MDRRTTNHLQALEEQVAEKKRRQARELLEEREMLLNHYESYGVGARGRASDDDLGLTGLISQKKRQLESEKEVYQDVLQQPSFRSHDPFADPTHERRAPVVVEARYPGQKQEIPVPVQPQSRNPSNITPAAPFHAVAPEKLHMEKDLSFETDRDRRLRMREERRSGGVRVISTNNAAGPVEPSGASRSRDPSPVRNVPAVSSSSTGKSRRDEIYEMKRRKFLSQRQKQEGGDDSSHLGHVSGTADQSFGGVDGGFALRPPEGRTERERRKVHDDNDVPGPKPAGDPWGKGDRNMAPEPLGHDTSSDFP